MESGRTKPSEHFARRADEYLLPDPHQRRPAPQRARAFQRPLPCAPAALGVGQTATNPPIRTASKFQGKSNAGFGSGLQ
ncbi:hypothetical protein [Streptomyces sp. NPDC057381]